MNRPNLPPDTTFTVSTTAPTIFAMSGTISGTITMFSLSPLTTPTDGLTATFLEFYFFEKVFRTEVGRFEDFLKFRFVVLVLFEQTPIVSVCIEEYVPRAPLQACHAFLLN